MSTKDFYIRRSFIQDGPKVRTTQMSINGLMGKQIEIYPKNGILLNNNNKKDTLLIPAATWMNLKNMPVKKTNKQTNKKHASEKSQT